MRAKRKVMALFKKKLSATVSNVGLSLVPLWSYNTIGQIFSTPCAEYSRQFFPFDRPGFWFDPTPPLTTLPRDMLEHAQGLGAFFRHHTLASVPTAMERLSALGEVLFGGWRLAKVPFFAMGSWVAVRYPMRRVAVMSCVAESVAHLGFAHPPSWVAHYLETVPVLYMLVGSLVN